MCNIKDQKNSIQPGERIRVARWFNQRRYDDSGETIK